MFHNLGMMLGLYSTQFWLAQVGVPVTGTQPVNPPTEAALVFSGPQFLMALVAGVLMAFAFQFLLTNFTLAAGISSW